MTVALAGAAPVKSNPEAVKRIAFSLNIAAAEYAKGVSGGRVTKPAEYDEARELFARADEQFRRVARDASLDAWTLEPVESSLKALGGKIERKEEARAVRAAAERVGVALSQAFGVSTRPQPERPPSLALGRTVYQARCMLCHGVAGNGRGPAAVGLKTQPFDFTERSAMRSLSTSQLWQTATVGVEGTAMISWADYLSEQDRWDVAAYLRTFAMRPEEIASGRLLSERCLEKIPADVREPNYWIEHSDDDAAAKIAAACGFKTAQAEALVAFLRSDERASPQVEKDPANAAAFAEVKAKVRKSLQFYKDAPAQAVDAALDAYLRYEPLESWVNARDPVLSASLESAFGRLRNQMAGHATQTDVESSGLSIIADLDRAAGNDAPRGSTWMLLFQSLLIILREGIEAILILAAIAAALRRAGLADRMPTLAAGAAAGVLASFATAWALDGLLRKTGLSREALEGVTMLAAVVMLFFVSNWLLSKVNAARWKEFIDGRLRSALGGGGLFAVAAVSFLAVYREGFETVLFYRALFDLAAGAAAPVWAGLILGLAALSLVFAGIQRFGLKIPVRGFFAATGALLFVLAFSFAGQGISALQAAGWLPITPIGWLPDLPALNVHSTLETFVGQALLIAAMGACAAYSLLVRPMAARRGVSARGLGDRPAPSDRSTKEIRRP